MSETQKPSRWVLLICIKTSAFMQRKMCYLCCIFYFILFNVCVETTEKWLLTLKPTPFPFLILPKKGKVSKSLCSSFSCYDCRSITSALCGCCHFFILLSRAHLCKPLAFRNNLQGKDHFKVTEPPPPDDHSVVCVCPGLVG